jgi:kynurenine formamidase
MPYIPTEVEVLGYFDKLSNWGRWGRDDELGTLNLITPQKRLEAIGTVRDGLTIGCAWPIVKENPVVDVQYPPQHFMVQSGEAPGSIAALDFIGMVFHGHTITHVDALSHQFWSGRLYNDRASTTVTTEQGASTCSVEAMKDGIITRGVLLDIAGLKNKSSLDAGEGIYPEDLEVTERTQGVLVNEGDALLVRTGWLARRFQQGPYPKPPARPGLHAASLPWLHERGVAVIAADAAHDVVPSDYEKVPLPVHMVGMVMMGLCLIDGCQFDDLLAECKSRDRWEFLFVVAPLRLRNATGSPVTPLAVL